jgi:hypothetical protein
MKIDLEKIKIITQEGVKKALELEAAKKAEEERLRVEAEIQEKLRKKFNDLVKKEIENFKNIALSAAFEGWYGATITVDMKIAPVLKTHLSQLGFSCEILNKKDKVDVGLEVDVLNEVDRKNAVSELCYNELREVELICNQSSEFIKSDAINYINTIENKGVDLELRHVQHFLFNWDEKDVEGNSIHDDECVDVMIELNSRIRNLIESCLIINSKFDNDKSKYNVEVSVSWKQHTWMSGVMEEMFNPHTLNWLSSGAGQGFVNNLKTCIENSASLGKSSLSLDFVSLGINKVRWGLNEAFKVMLDEKPIGVIPFRIDLIIEMMVYIGFKTNVSDKTVLKSQIEISW